MLSTVLAIASLLTPAADEAATAKLAEAAMKTWHVPGLAVAVVHDEETVFLKGFGVRTLGRPAPVTPNTVFPLASCTKSFTTTLLALLVDDEVLGWDDPVGKHLPGFQLADANASALLTMRDLVCHRTGLGGHDLLWYRAPWGTDEIVRRMQRLPLDYPFRTGYRYSSLPFYAAGRAIEKRTGEKWDKLVRTRICEPLGMSGVSFTTAALARDADRASGHRLDRDGAVSAMPSYEIAEPNAAGSINATAADLATWLKFHLARGVGPDGKRRISAQNLSVTHTPQNLIPMRGAARTLNPESVQLSYAMGWIVQDYRGKKVLSHGGLIDGFRVQLTFLPEEKLGFAVLCNLHDTRLPMALTNSLIDHYGRLEAKDWNGYYRDVVKEDERQRQRALEARNKARDPNSKPSLAIDGYAGEYDHPAYGPAKVALADGKLAVRYGSMTFPLEHFEGDRFRIVGGKLDEELVPFTVAGGKAAAVKFAGQEFRRK